jgi:hypothetical protein
MMELGSSDQIANIFSVIHNYEILPLKFFSHSLVKISVHFESKILKESILGHKLIKNIKMNLKGLSSGDSSRRRLRRNGKNAIRL